MVIRDKNEVMQDATLQLLVFQLAFQLLGLADFADGPVEVILADKAAPMLRQSVPGLGLAQDVRQCPLVDSTVSHFIKERRGDPWLYHKPTAKVNTANLVAVVVKVSGTRFKVTGEHKLAISDSKLWDTLGQLTMLAKV